MEVFTDLHPNLPCAGVAQLVEQQSCKLLVAGSTPVTGPILFDRGLLRKFTISVFLPQRGQLHRSSESTAVVTSPAE